MKTLLAHTHAFKKRQLAFLLALLAILPCASPLAIAQVQRPAINITAYNIDAELDPDAHTLKATAKVTFTALQPVDTAVFQLHSALKVDKVTDGTGKVLSGERGTDATIRLTLTTPMSKGQTTTFTFEYGGVLSGTEESPVEGLEARLDRRTYQLSVVSGPLVSDDRISDRPLHRRYSRDRSDGIPGYRQRRSIAARPIAAGPLSSTGPSPAFPARSSPASSIPRLPAPSASYVHIWTTDAHKAAAPDFADTAAKEFNYFTGLFGPAESVHFNVVELPDDTLPAFWAPEIAIIPGNRMTKANSRLLANTVAHQWWGSQVSPATLNDAWITNGMCRYSELMYTRR